MTGSSEPGPRLPRLHVVTDDRVFARADFLSAAETALDSGGADLVLHLRAPGAGGRPLHAAAKRLVAKARATGSIVLVNGRVDVALAAAAHGVHLPARGLPPAVARRLLPPGALVGASVHSLAEARDAVGARDSIGAEGSTMAGVGDGRMGPEGVSFLVAGTLFPSESHPGVPAAGLEWLRDLVRLGPPVVGIGGIDASRMAEVMAAGAYGVAVRGAVWSARDPAGAVASLIETLKEMEG